MSDSGILAAALRGAAERFGEAPALVADDGEEISFRDLDGWSDEVAAGLARAGVGEGSVVALRMGSCPEYAAAYLALAKLGAVTAGVNPRLTEAEQDTALAVVGPDEVLGEKDVAALRLAGAAASGASAVGADPDRPVCIVLTSGTTGQPKGAVFTDRQLAAVVEIDTGGAWGGGGPMLSGTQFAHVGFMTKLPWYLRRGHTIHLLDRWRADRVLDLIEQARIPSVGGVAAQLALLLRVPDFDSRDLAHVQTLVMGGGPSPPALVEEARRRFGAAYSIRYSSTESGGVGTGTAFDADDEEALFTVGRPRAGVDLSIRSIEDETDGEPVAEGEVGEVWLRSGAVMSGYWRDPSATETTLVEEGWLRTGDLGRIDEAGCLRLAGRRKEMFIRGGYNVYPMEVEAVLASHPRVGAVAVAPRPDPVMGEVGVAVVVAAEGEAVPSLDELRTFGSERLAAYKLPEALRVVDELPLTAGQKVDRRVLAEHERERNGGG